MFSQLQFTTESTNPYITLWASFPYLLIYLGQITIKASPTSQIKSKLFFGEGWEENELSGPDRIDTVNEQQCYSESKVLLSVFLQKVKWGFPDAISYYLNPLSQEFDVVPPKRKSRPVIRSSRYALARILINPVIPPKIISIRLRGIRMTNVPCMSEEKKWRVLVF